jgi:DNA-binding HxlR family transcriptional regulator
LYCFELAGERWNLLLLRELVQGRSCYESMCVDLGIARNVLAARLRALVEEGIVARVKYQERPDRYRYELTPKGQGLVPVVLALDEWAERCRAGSCAA